MSSTNVTTFELMKVVSTLISRRFKKRKISVLDAGCGRGKNAYLVKYHCLEYGGEANVVGVDIQRSFLDFPKTMKVYDYLICSDCKRLPFKAHSFDIVICSEVIEHLEKKEGVALLQDFERFLKAKGSIVVSIPQGKQESHNGYEEHKSIWVKKDLEAVGYKVLTSPLVLRSPFGMIFLPQRTLSDKSWRNSIMNFLQLSVSNFSFLIPSISGKLIAFKLKN